MRVGYVYITSNPRRTTFYIGVTNNIVRRMSEHRQRTKGFTSRYQVYQLVYYERFDSIVVAIRREKQLKKWNRQWKIDLIKSVNPKMLAIEVGY